MVKEQKRSNREIKKPKKDKAAPAPQSGLTKGMTTSVGMPKPKK